MKPQTIGLAVLLAGSLFASEPTPEEIKLQNQYVESTIGPRPSEKNDIIFRYFVGEIAK